MTHIEKMLEELERRNYSQTTVRIYRTTICDLERYFKRAADELEPEQVREYQAYLFRERKLMPNTVNQRTGALRFFFITTLRKPWTLDDMPYSRRVFQLPKVLSQDEVARMIDAAPNRWYRLLVMALYATGAPCGTCPTEDQRYRQPAHGHSHPGRQGKKGSRRDAERDVARSSA